MGGGRKIRRGLFEALDTAGGEQGPHLGDGDGGDVVASFQCSVFREDEEVRGNQ